MTEEIPLSEAEELFLNLGYNRFYDLYSEILQKDFWEKLPEDRFNKITQAFAVYAELLSHEPFDQVIDWLKRARPPMESDIVGPFFLFIRHLLVHFPFYTKWDDVWISKPLANWRRQNQSIDRFLEKYSGHHQVKYRFKESNKDEFTFVSINFPSEYNDQKIYLRDMIEEEGGIKLSLVMMSRVLNTQVLSVEPGNGDGGE